MHLLRNRADHRSRLPVYEWEAEGLITFTLKLANANFRSSLADVLHSVHPGRQEQIHGAKAFEWPVFVMIYAGLDQKARSLKTLGAAWT